MYSTKCLIITIDFCIFRLFFYRNKRNPFGISIEQNIRKKVIIMPLPDEQIDSKKTDEIKAAPAKSGLNTKIFIFGIPVFMIQLVAVYFITANILMKRFESRASVGKDSTQTGQISDTANNKTKVELGKYIFPVDDVIVNPAGTDGKRLLLTSVGIDLRSDKMMTELKSREALVKDVIISTLSSKDVDQLNNTMYRDTLKTEIAEQLTKMVPNIGINTIYFSKYILQ